MKAVKAKITKALNVGSYIICADNTGAKLLRIISVLGYKGVRRRQPRAGVGDVVKVSVREGSPKVRKQIFNAVIVRQKKEFRRPNGLRVSFEDNAAILVDENFEPKGTQIKGPIAKEVVERFPSIGRIATMVV
jgi:large subunit ribosomal protein L14